MVATRGLGDWGVAMETIDQWILYITHSIMLQVGIRCSDVLLHHRVTIDNNYVLHVPPKIKESILNVSIIKKC
jgi:hypothetical protein